MVGLGLLPAPRHAPSCGYCLEASMTAPATLWFPAYAGMTVKGAGYDGRPVSLPLWVTGQVGNDGEGLFKEHHLDDNYLYKH